MVWVDSPLAGLQAYHVAAAGRDPVVGQYTLGDPGSGRNKEWNALAQPFDIDPGWLRSLRHSIERQLPRGVAARALNGELFATGGAALVALAAHLRTAVPSVPQAQSLPIEGRLIERVGRASLGTGWDRYEGIIGNALMRELRPGCHRSNRPRAARHPRADAATGGTTPRARHVAKAIRAMQPGQFDAVWPAYGLLLGVLDTPPWRAIGRRRAARLRQHLRLAEAAGPWWALDGLGHRVRATRGRAVGPQRQAPRGVWAGARLG